MVKLTVECFLVKKNSQLQKTQGVVEILSQFGRLWIEHYFKGGAFV